MLVSTKVVGYLSYARLSYANAWCVRCSERSGYPAYRTAVSRASCPFPCRAISMFTVVPLSYNRLDDSKKRRVVKTIADFPIEFGDE